MCLVPFDPDHVQTNLSELLFSDLYLGLLVIITPQHLNSFLNKPWMTDALRFFKDARDETIFWAK